MHIMENLTVRHGTPSESIIEQIICKHFGNKVAMTRIYYGVTENKSYPC